MTKAKKKLSFDPKRLLRFMTPLLCVSTAQTKSPEAFKRSGLLIASWFSYTPEPPLGSIVSTDTPNSVCPTRYAVMSMVNIERTTPVAANDARDEHRFRLHRLNISSFST